MARMVDLDDLIDAEEVRVILKLSRRTSVSVYQRRYPDMPRPILERPTIKLWSRKTMIEWTKGRKKP